MFTLIIENRNGEIVDEHLFEEGELVVGRSQHSDVILASPNVSRRHARLFVQAGRAYVEDLSSANGTWVGGRRIHGVHEVGHSAQIRVGDFVLHLEGTPYRTGPHQPVHGKLTMLLPEGPGRVFWINKPTMLVGRGRDAAVTILDPSISRIHAKISVDSAGRVFAEDLQSANGTYVNGERVSRRELHGHDILRLGNQDLRFESASASFPSASQAHLTPAPAPSIPSFRPARSDPSRLFTPRPLPSGTAQPRPGSSRTFWVVLLLVLLLVGTVTALVLVVANRPSPGSGGPPPKARAGGRPTTGADAGSQPDPGPSQVEVRRNKLRGCIRRCKRAHMRNDLDTMESALECAEEIDPTGAEVVTLRNRLKLERRWTRALAGARDALRDGRPGTALRRVKTILPESNVYAEAVELRVRTRQAIEDLGRTFTRTCRRRRKASPRCLKITRELLLVRPTDTQLLKKMRQWRRR